MNHILYSFRRAFEGFFFLSSLAAIVGEIEICPPKKFNVLNFFDRIAPKFAGKLERPPSTYIKNLVMISLVGILRTELS